MTNSLSQINNSLTMWEDSNKINEIRKLFAPKLTEMEFQYFVGLGKSTGLNPFLREIWSVKYDERSPASVFIGRDGYRKAAQAQSDYDYHQTDAVYENDTFEIQDGIVKHSYKLTHRGTLIGAYCIAKRRKSSRPMYVFVELKEYTTGKSVWNAKPATMIKKVAESQCLRACFQDLLGGTYGEEEVSNYQIENNNVRLIDGATQTENLKNILKANSSNGITSEVKEIDYIQTINVETATKDFQNSKEADPIVIFSNTSMEDKRISQEEIDHLEIRMDELGFDDARKKRAMGYYKIDKLSDLTSQQGLIFMSQLNKA